LQMTQRSKIWLKGTVVGWKFVHFFSSQTKLYFSRQFRFLHF
jgi:hypothetical protein